MGYLDHAKFENEHKKEESTEENLSKLIDSIIEKKLNNILNIANSEEKEEQEEQEETIEEMEEKQETIEEKESEE